jgi:ferric-dicitrate binding protein FerR (iron transport regulator)
MSEWKIDGREVSSTSLWRVIEDFENGALSPDAQEELLQILEESQRARAIYLKHFELTALLQIKAATQAEEGTLPVLNDRQRQRKVLRFSILAAAAVIALLAGFAAFVGLNAAVPRSAELTASEGSVWTIAKNGDDPKPTLEAVEEGSTLQVSSGTVVLELESGTRYVVQGPAKVRFPKLETPVLEHGWFWADTGLETEELEITTDTHWFRDIGTRFGIRVRDDQQVELHVFEGMVEVGTPTTGKKSKALPGNAGFVVAADGDLVDTALAVDPFPGLLDLLQAQPRYATTVMGQAPSGYWRLDETEVGSMINQVPGAPTGMCATSVDPHAAGMRPASGFFGFEEENRGAYLPGEDSQSVLYHLDSTAGVSLEEGSVAFWFRRSPDIETTEVLWYAGVPDGGGLGPQMEMHAFLSDAGRVQFFMENGKQDVLLSSSQNSADSQWHHVVASWRRGAVELYLDGQLAARDRGDRTTREHHLTGTNIRFGKTGSGRAPGPGDLGYFRGWVDEIALWNRALTETEVDLQFRAARAPALRGQEVE